jgi:ABC-2 type transport system ATP-binding protein
MHVPPTAVQALVFPSSAASSSTSETLASSGTMVAEELVEPHAASSEAQATRKRASRRIMPFRVSATRRPTLLNVAPGRAKGWRVDSALRPPAAIQTGSLTRRFGDVVAVDGIDLVVETGTFFGLLGSNGAGKSTTIKMLTTLLPPSSGTAEVAGFDVLRQPRGVRKRIGYVPQMLSADSGLTGVENLLLSAKLYRVAPAEQSRRASEALAFMGLEDVGGRLVKTYSGGMIRRLEIAQALLHRPSVVFLDEPTVGLDPVARHAVWDKLRDLQATFGTTVLLTTHDMEEADALCEKIAIMLKGRIVALGSPEELKAAVGEGATMDDVFVRFTGGPVDQGEGGSYRDVARTRRTARRLG